VKALGKGWALVRTLRELTRWRGFDTIVLAVGSTPDDRLATDLKGKVLELHVIGMPPSRGDPAGGLRREDAAIKIGASRDRVSN